MVWLTKYSNNWFILITIIFSYLPTHVTASQLFATAHTGAAPPGNIGVCSSFTAQMTSHITTYILIHFIICKNTEKVGRYALQDKHKQIDT